MYVMYVRSPSMKRTQIYLTEDQNSSLGRLSRASGQSKSEIIRTALDQFMAANDAKPDWREAMEKIRGIWADDPETIERIKEVREEFDRRIGPK